MIEIDAIFLDIGNTLRILIENEPHQAKARHEIVRLIGIDEDPIVFCDKLNNRYKIYRKWAFENMREAPEVELWIKWLIPEFPAEHIAPLSKELTYQYRQSMGLRVMVDQAKEVIHKLDERGYILGIISNLITSEEIPDWLEADGLTHYFKSVALSSVIGIRKPDPEIYLLAAQNAGVSPSRCAYVGDNLKRDVTGTRAADFGLAVIIINEQELLDAVITPENAPDAIIHKFSDLLKLFPHHPMVNPDLLCKS